MEQNPTLSTSTRDNDTVIECPQCGFQKIVNIAKFFKNANVGDLISKCKCGNSFSVILERRKFERHYFDTNGNVLRERTKGKPENHPVTVKDLSRSGVKFVTAQDHTFDAGDNIVVALEFNDHRKTYFIKEATVRHVTGKNVRAEFKSLCGDVALLMHPAPDPDGPAKNP